MSHPNKEWFDELFQHIIFLGFCQKERENLSELAKLITELRKFYIATFPSELLEILEPQELDDYLSFLVDVRLDLAFYYAEPEVFYKEMARQWNSPNEFLPTFLLPWV